MRATAPGKVAASRRRRDRESPSRLNAINIASIVAVFILVDSPGAFAAPFADKAALKTAVDNCLAVDATGRACCNHSADCGAAGTTEMADWDVSLVTDMNDLFFDKGSFNATYRGGRQLGHEHVPDVQERLRVQRGHIAVGRQLGREHAQDVSIRLRVQRGHNAVGYQLGHEHGTDVFYSQRLDTKVPQLRLRQLPPGVRRGCILHASTATAHGPPAAWVRRDDACDASPPLSSGRRQLHRHPVSGTSSSPSATPGMCCRA